MTRFQSHLHFFPQIIKTSLVSTLVPSRAQHIHQDFWFIVFWVSYKYVCIYVYFSPSFHMLDVLCSCSHVLACACMWGSLVDTGTVLQLLLHCLLWGRLSHADLKLTNSDSQVGQLALRIFCLHHPELELQTEHNSHVSFK